MLSEGSTNGYATLYVVLLYSCYSGGEAERVGCVHSALLNERWRMLERAGTVPRTREPDLESEFKLDEGRLDCQQLVYVQVHGDGGKGGGKSQDTARRHCKIITITD